MDIRCNIGASDRNYMQLIVDSLVVVINYISAKFGTYPAPVLGDLKFLFAFSH